MVRKEICVKKRIIFLDCDGVLASNRCDLNAYHSDEEEELILGAYD